MIIGSDRRANASKAALGKGALSSEAMKKAATQTRASSTADRSVSGGGQVRYLMWFALIFIALYSLYYFLKASPYWMHYFVWIAASISYVFNFFDPNVGFHNNMILYNNNPSLEIVADCDGVAFLMLITAAVLPFARSTKAKIIGLLLLIPLLLVMNWLRIFILSALYFYYPNHFEFVHLYLFQTIMILITVLSFILWIFFSESKPSGH